MERDNIKPNLNSLNLNCNETSISALKPEGMIRLASREKDEAELRPVEDEEELGLIFVGRPTEGWG